MKHRLTAIILIVCLSFVAFPYIIFAEPDVEAKETTVWKSSDYLNPDSPVTENNPWSVESTNNADGTWQQVTNTVKTEDEKPLFPTMPDGQQPTTGYISTGNYSGNWGNEGVNMAVSGKYMIPGCFWTGMDGDAPKSTENKIAKVFTAPKTGKIRISAVGGEILSNHITWAEDTMGWVVSKSDGTEIWKKVYSDRVEGSSYDTVTFDNQFIDVTEGEKIYFILQPQKWAIRAEQACIWDPVVEYGDFHVVSKAEYTDDGTVTVSFDNVAANPGADAVIITAAYEGEVLLGCKLTKLSEITENKVSISNLVKKPDSVKILTWEFGADTKMKPLMDVISKTVTEAAAGG